MLKMIVGKSVGVGEDCVRLQNLFKDFFHQSGRFLLADGLPFLRWLDVGGGEKAMRKVAEEMEVVVGEWLKEHKEKRRRVVDGVKVEDDFMDVLLNVLDDQAHIDGRDSDTVNKATCLAFVLAGSDTTSISMDWLLALLVNHPDILRKAQIELDNVVGKQRRVQGHDIHNLVYLKAIIKETLRLYPAGATGIPHKATENCNIANHVVPKGTWIIINISKIQRDQKVWPDPDEFRPDRFLTTQKEIDFKGQNFELIPFGSGRRMCPGVNFALQIIQLTIATLLHGFDFARPSNELVDMTAESGLTNPRASPLEIMLSPRLSPELYE